MKMPRATWVIKAYLRLRTEAHEPAVLRLTFTTCLMKTDGHMPWHAELAQLDHACGCFVL